MFYYPRIEADQIPLNIFYFRTVRTSSLRVVNLVVFVVILLLKVHKINEKDGSQKYSFYANI